MSEWDIIWGKGGRVSSVKVGYRVPDATTASFYNLHFSKRAALETLHCTLQVFNNLSVRILMISPVGTIKIITWIKYSWLTFTFVLEATTKNFQLWISFLNYHPDWKIVKTKPVHCWECEAIALPWLSHRRWRQLSHGSGPRHRLSESRKPAKS